MLSRAEIKRNAKKSILSNYGSVIVVSIAVAACFLIQYLISYNMTKYSSSLWTALLGIIVYILLLPAYVGVYGFFHKIYRNEDGANIKNVIEIGFKENYGRNLLGMLLRDFKLFLWSLIGLVPFYFGLVLTLVSSFQGNPFSEGYTGGLTDTFAIFMGSIIISIVGFIPYFIKVMAYSMTPYILAEDGAISSSQAVKLSVVMTKGHKSEIFMMCLSFIGWMILTIFTLGILGVFWTGPYIATSVAGIYEELKNEHVPQSDNENLRF